MEKRYAIAVSFGKKVRNRGFSPQKKKRGFPILAIKSLASTKRRKTTTKRDKRERERKYARTHTERERERETEREKEYGAYSFCARVCCRVFIEMCTRKASQ